MSRLGWLMVFIVVFIAAALFGFFFLTRSSADILGATLEPVGGGEAIQTASFVGKPTILILFTPT
jgi:flagellar basal body-associated protein FliL